MAPVHHVPSGAPFMGARTHFATEKTNFDLAVDHWEYVLQGLTGNTLKALGLPCGERSRAANGVADSDVFVLCTCVPGLGTNWRDVPPESSGETCVLPLAPGARVRAIWAGDGRRYDAIVAEIKNGLVEVNWLRPAPLSGEAGGDDTSHRQVQHQHVALAPEVQQFLDPIGSSFFVDRPVPAEGNMPVSARGSPISTIRRIPTKLKSSTSL
eukprot:TRINITY_DN9398_c0_g1_i1.p1 TRINITY_DN9398_c0_g1~~TRINITY_DN9398_c0_g1_i1.p1  ORF type:complete len:219 (+),score=30.22 TRINITY_DN9398_c0_g1_i1:26-658(+)